MKSKIVIMNHPPRPRFSAPFLTLIIILILIPPPVAQADPVDDSLKRATAFLLQQQDETGAIWERKPHYRNQTTMSSLAVVALHALGHNPTDETPEGKASRRAIDYVLRPANQDEKGYFGAKDGARMYAQGITTWMLAQMSGYGADAGQNNRMAAAASRALDLIVQAQGVSKSEKHQGGWRYVPDSSDSDLSVSTWQIMALSAAGEARFKVPQRSVDAAAGLILRCYETPDARNSRYRKAGFGYQAPGRELSTSAEGLFALLACGRRNLPEITLTAKRLREEKMTDRERWLFYTLFFQAQAAHLLGGDEFPQAQTRAAAILLPLQAEDGSWEGVGGEERQGGKVYATALAVLTLAK